MSRRARLRAGFLAVAILLGGCGANHTATQPVRNRVTGTSDAPPLVSMRRIDGATYETVLIRSDGTGDVGVFIGEWTGIDHWQFRLGSDRLAQLRHLVAIAARVTQTPGFGSTPSTEYILFTPGHVLETAKGHVPRRLAGLTSTLSQLIDRYG